MVDGSWFPVQLYVETKESIPRSNVHLASEFWQANKIFTSHIVFFANCGLDY